MHIHLKADPNIELPAALLIIEAMGKLGEGKKYPVLIDAPNFAVEIKTYQFFRPRRCETYTIADVISNTGLLKNCPLVFTLNVINRKCQKAFSGKAGTIVWLKTFIKSKQQ